MPGSEFQSCVVFTTDTNSFRNRNSNPCHPERIEGPMQFSHAGSKTSLLCVSVVKNRSNQPQVPAPRAEVAEIPEEAAPMAAADKVSPAALEIARR